MCRETLDLNLSVQPIRIISARPRASLRSDLEGRTDRAAWAWRGSMQNTGSPAALKECHSHGDVGPLSNPTLAARGAWVCMKAIKAAGSDGTSASIKTRPETFRTQTAVFWSETSNATY